MEEIKMITNCRDTFSFELRYSRDDGNSNKHCDECNCNEAFVLTSGRVNSVGKVIRVRHRSCDRVGTND